MTDGTKDVPVALIAKYLSAAATDLERDAVERWLAADPTHPGVLESYRVAYTAAAVSPSLPAEWTEDAMWSRLTSQGVPGTTETRRGVLTLVGSAPPLGATRHAALGRPRPWISADARRLGIWGAVAATALVTVTGYVMHRSSVDTSSLVPAHDYVTAPGQRETVTLTDGTQVTLGPDSRVHLGAGYGRTRRDVTLSGEAYFSVVHDVWHPFRVRAGGVVTTDIGTRFGVRAYAGDTAVQVVVAEGSVAVGGHTLVAQDLAIVGAAGTATVAHNIDANAALSWRDGELVFSRVPVRDAIPQLARSYGVTIRLADTALAHRTLTASFKDEPMTEVIDAVATAIGATVVWQEHTAIITPIPPVRPGGHHSFSLSTQ